MRIKSSTRYTHRNTLIGGYVTFRQLFHFLLALVALAFLLAAFYAEEETRGKRAWERHKAQAAAKGFVMDWATFIPPAVPDEQNFFKAPHMQAWFVVRGGNALSSRLDMAEMDEALLAKELVPCIDVTAVPSNSIVEAGSADIVLQYDPPLLSLAPSSNSSTEDNSKASLSPSRVSISSNALKQLKLLLESRSNYFNPPRIDRHLTDVNQRPIVLGKPTTQPPVKVIVRTDRALDNLEIRGFFPMDVTHASKDSLTIITTDSGKYRVGLMKSGPVPAEEFLAWSDSFKPDFAEINTALDRPYARMDGDYSKPFEIPVPNFVVTRKLAQILALRAQAHLLLGEPGKALQDITLMHLMSRYMEGRPTSKPMTLVAAMVNVAVKGLYISVVGDGFKLHAWHEPEMSVIQRQLGEIQLLPYVRNAFYLESIGFGEDVSMTSSSEMADKFLGLTPTTLWEELRKPDYLYLRFAPHGWLYQSAVVSSRLMQSMIESIDVSNQIVLTSKIKKYGTELARLTKSKSPFNFFAKEFAPNFTRAMQMASKNQTLANEAFVVCALERYKLAQGHYPDSSDALMPQYADALPHDLFGGAALKYRREGDGFILYSIGWNGKDDGGVPCWKEDLIGDVTQNDWVWPNPVHFSEK